MVQQGVQLPNLQEKHCKPTADFWLEAPGFSGLLRGLPTGPKVQQSLLQ